MSDWAEPRVHTVQTMGGGGCGALDKFACTALWRCARALRHRNLRKSLARKQVSGLTSRRTCPELMGLLTWGRGGRGLGLGWGIHSVTTFPTVRVGFGGGVLGWPCGRAGHPVGNYTDP